MSLESDLKLQSMDNANNLYNDIRLALSNPTKKIDGEALKIYQELDDWQFLEKFPIQDEKNHWLYMVMISMQQYRHLKWKKEHPSPVKTKRSKWDIVHGKLGKS